MGQIFNSSFKVEIKNSVEFFLVQMKNVKWSAAFLSLNPSWQCSRGLVSKFKEIERDRVGHEPAAKGNGWNTV